MQLWRFMYADNPGRNAANAYIRDIDAAARSAGVQDGFGQAFLEKARSFARCGGGLHLQHVHAAADGTRKMLFATDDDDSAQVETVLIPVVRGQARTLHCRCRCVAARAYLAQHPTSWARECSTLARLPQLSENSSGPHTGVSAILLLYQCPCIWVSRCCEGCVCHT